MARILVTGAAGFIGFHTSRLLLSQGHEVVAIDNVNDYYDPTLKRARLAILAENPQFALAEIDLADGPSMRSWFETNRPQRVIHLAAQAGVRYSLTNPDVYLQSNVNGFLHILEGCRHNGIEHLTYASSSSVYGSNVKMPLSVQDNVDHPISLYAATKKANELMAHSYSHLFNLATTGLRFFTVYGPWGRPDMALFLFTRAILEGKPIDVYNNGEMQRDFTFVDDIVEAVTRVSNRIPQANPEWDGVDPSTSRAPYSVFNIGGGQPVKLLRYIEVLEDALGKRAEKNMLPLQPGDVPATEAESSILENAIGFRPKVTIEEGIPRFVDWYRSYYGV